MNGVAGESVGSGLVHLATYCRRVGASLERVWENVLDWEHLPWLHDRAFAAIEREESGPWGWRARIQPRRTPQPGFRLELLVEQEAGRYVSRTLDGPDAGSEIWTELRPRGPERTDIRVSFHHPRVSPERRDAAGRAYVRLYARLWDEDEAMMQHRERELRAEPSPAAGPVSLGAMSALRERLPLCVELGGRRFRLVLVDGEVVAHAASCPHMRGPLDAAPVEEGQVRCPWHGYRFDVRSGRSSDGRGLRLFPAPRLEEGADGEARLVPRA